MLGTEFEVTWKISDRVQILCTDMCFLLAGFVQIYVYRSSYSDATLFFSDPSSWSAADNSMGGVGWFRTTLKLLFQGVPGFAKCVTGMAAAVLKANAHGRNLTVR